MLEQDKINLSDIVSDWKTDPEKQKKVFDPDRIAKLIEETNREQEKILKRKEVSEEVLNRRYDF